MFSKGKPIKRGTCNKHSHPNCVAIVPIFNHLDQPQMEEVMDHVHAVTFNRGETIYRAGDKAKSLYITHAGKIKIYRLSDEGKEQIVRILQPGDFTGELAIFKDTVHEAYAEALAHTKVCIISRSIIQKLIIDYPSISLKILEEFAHRLEQSEMQATRFATESVDARLALFLVENMETKSNRIDLPMNYKEVASYIGTTPETVSRVLKDFEDKDYIKKKNQKQIDILNADALLLL